MKYTLEDVFSLFTPLTEIPPEIQTIKNNFPLRIFSDVSSGLAISDVNSLNFSEFIKVPNPRQNRGAQPRAKQYTPKFVIDNQQRPVTHQHQVPEEPIQWDKPDPDDKFDDLLCPDFRAGNGKDMLGDSFRHTTASDAVLDVMELISAPDGKKDAPSKYQTSLVGDLQAGTADKPSNAKKEPPAAYASDDIEDVLQKLEQDPAIGPAMNLLPDNQSIPKHSIPNFPIPPANDTAIFGLPALPYTQMIPGVQPAPNQFVFSMYPPQQQVVGFAGPMGAAPAIQMPAMQAIPAMYTVPMQQPPPTYEVNWEYLDLNNMMRGPFSSMQMWNWYKQGSLPSTLRIRVAGDSGPFLPLISRWAKSLARGVDPFSTPPSELSYQ